MKKILFGLMGLLLTGSIIAGAAYAAFSATATVSGINFSTGGAGLAVSKDGTTFSPTLDAALNITNAIPGFGVADDQMAHLWIQNTSTNINLGLMAQLTAAGGWGAGLENYVEMAIVTNGTPVTNGDYHTLSLWNSTGFALLPSPLNASTTQEYDVYVRLPNSAPNSVANKSLTNITFTITGNQQ